MIKKEDCLFHERTESTTSIYGIRAEKVLFCNFPATWHIEAAVVIRKSGKKEETVYISICGQEPDMVQVTRNSIFASEADSDPEYKIDVIESYETMQEAKKSCCWNTIRKVLQR